MAGLNQIQGGRWDNFLRKVFPIKERSIAPILAPELVGYVTVQEWEPELFWARDERLGWGVTGRAAVVGEIAHVQLLNPIDSASLVIVEKIVFDTTSAAIDLASNTGQITGAIRAATAPRDQRFATLPNIGATVAQLLNASNAAALGSAAYLRILPTATGISIELEFSMIIPPGESLIIRNTGPTAALGVNIFWRERPAEATELT